MNVVSIAPALRFVCSNPRASKPRKCRTETAATCGGTVRKSEHSKSLASTQTVDTISPNWLPEGHINLTRAVYPSMGTTCNTVCVLLSAIHNTYASADIYFFLRKASLFSSTFFTSVSSLTCRESHSTW